MKTELAVLLGLTISLGEFTSGAAVLAVETAFGASLSQDNSGTTDLLKVGYAASVNATSASAFTNPSGSDTPQALVGVDIAASVASPGNTFYQFRLVYNRSASSLDMYLFGAQGNNTVNTSLSASSNQNGSQNPDELNLAGATPLNWNNNQIKGLAFGFDAPTDYRVTLQNMTFGSTGAWVGGGTKTLTFNGGSGASGISDINNGYYLDASGLTDGFTLDGIFQALYTGSGSVDQATKLGFEVYAVVPEPATVAFGLALVGGLGLLEVRRRKIS